MKGLLLALLLLSGPAFADSVIWNAATEYPATAMPGEGLTALAARVAILTRGHVTIVPGYDAPNGLRSASIPYAVQGGRLQVGDAFAGSIGTIDKLFQLSSLPFLATTEVDARRLLDLARPAYASAFARLGQRILYVTPWPPSGIWSRVPILGLDDLASLKIRTYDVTSTSVLNRAGATAIELSFADATPRLRDGAVNAVLSSGDGGAGRKLWEFTPHFTEIGYAMPLSFATVSEAALQLLAPDTRAEVLRAGEETEAVQWHALTTRSAANYATMRGNGVTISAAPLALSQALAVAARDVIEAWERDAGPEAARVLTAYRNARSH